MRLLNTSSGDIQDYFEPNIPRYAILSHRWTAEEITYKDFLKGRRKDTIGYRKIIDFRTIAEQHGYEWVWADTICIDKRSSAELSEAINSMYKYYADSDLCYVHLSDVHYAGGSTTLEELVKAFMKSEWFDRGWTLQELLAPAEVVFCSSEWEVIGRKRGSRFVKQESVSDHWDPDVTLWAIGLRTGIPQNVFSDPKSFRSCCIAQRMSWAAGRTCTRIEDMAYCLLGLFGINMPLLYGEGKRAFKRLQVEIIKGSHDESIYAWVKPGAPLNIYEEYPIITDSVKWFKDCGDIVRVPGVVRLPWNVTHHGLEISLKADHEFGETVLEGFIVSPSPSTKTRVPSYQDHLQTALKFPLACRKIINEKSCEIVISRLRCGHWGRIYTNNLDGKQAKGCEKKMIKFERQRVYIHVDECEDLVSFFN